jgi:hypothetical protein
MHQARRPGVRPRGVETAGSGGSRALIWSDSHTCFTPTVQGIQYYTMVHAAPRNKTAGQSTRLPGSYLI